MRKLSCFADAEAISSVDDADFSNGQKRLPLRDDGLPKSYHLQ
jgi:hypothetical protein